MADHYDTLGVQRDASPAEIKAAYRRAANANHPDKHGGDGKAMAQVNAAYEVLSDAERRAQYDATGDGAKRKTVEDAARAMLHQLLMAAATAPEHVNCVEWAAGKFREIRVDAKEQLRQQNRDRERLTKRRAAVTVKAGDNLIHGIIDEHLATIERNISTVHAHLETAALAEKLLAEYESTEAPPTRAFPDVDGFHDAVLGKAAFSRGMKW